PIEVTLSIMTPYAAYLAAEYAHASGVLAVVACGLYLGRRENKLFSPQVRLQAYGFWNSFTFAINGLVFVLIGLQLPFVLSGIHDYSIKPLILSGGVFSALVTLLPIAWLSPGAFVATLTRRKVPPQNEPMPPIKGVFIIGWTGMRGVVALAAA